jgi:hypothetical protein
VFPYNNEIDQALLPYLDDLRKLLADEKSLDDLKCLVSAWIRKHKGRRYGHLACPPRYHISEVDACRVESWYDENVPEARVYRHIWLCGAGLYHAFTLLLAYRIQDTVFADPECPSQDHTLSRHQFLLQKA